MSETQFNPEETLTRKEYLKMKKKKNKKRKSKITYILITCLLCLSAYVFTQLYVYSANQNVVYNPGDKVYEDYYDIYYAVPSYTYNVKYDLVSVTAKGIEKKLVNSDGLYNIQKIEKKVYGIKDKKLFVFDTMTEKMVQVLEDESLIVNKFVIQNNKIYLATGTENEGKLQVADIDGKNIKEIYNKYVYQLCVEENAIYVIANEKSNSNLVKINTSNFSNSVMISDKIVNNINIIKDDIYFANGTDENKLYKVNKKDYTNCKKVSDTSMVVDNEFKNTNGNYAIIEYKDNVYFIAHTEVNKICVVDTDGNKTDIILDIQVEKMRLKDRYIFYTVKDEMGLFSYNIDTKDLRKVTEKRFSEFVI